MTPPKKERLTLKLQEAIVKTIKKNITYSYKPKRKIIKAPQNHQTFTPSLSGAHGGRSVSSKLHNRHFEHLLSEHECKSKISLKCPPPLRVTTVHSYIYKHLLLCQHVARKYLVRHNSPQILPL